MKKRLFACSIAFLLFVVFFLLGALLPQGYLIGGDFTYLIALLLSAILFFWGITMVYRVQYKNARILILSLFVLFYAWMGMRFMKWLPNIHYLSIYVDYSYYIPMMGVPILFLVLIGETVYPHWSKRYYLYIPCILVGFAFVLLSLTNDLHHLVYQNMTFRYAEDNPKIEIISYSYGALHYVAMGFIGSLAALSFVLFAIGNRKQARFRQLVLPLYVLLIIIAYSVLYLLGLSFIRDTPLIKDFALMMTLLLTILLETLLMVGLIQNKGQYGTNFRHSAIPMRIYDSAGMPAYSSLNFDEKAYLSHSPDYRYITKPLGDYTLVIAESVKEINGLRAKIEKENGDIADINAFLESTIRVTSEKPSLTYRLELVNEIESILREEDKTTLLLIESLPSSVDDSNREETLQKLGRIALLLGYMKQKCMLLLELKRHEAMAEDAFSLLLHVITKDIASVGFKDASFTLKSGGEVAISFAMAVNEFLNRVAYAYAFLSPYLMAIVDSKAEKVVIEIDAAAPVRDIEIKGMSVQTKLEEDALRIAMEAKR